MKMLYNREDRENNVTNTVVMKDTEEVFESIQRCERYYECESVGFEADGNYIVWTVEASSAEEMEEVIEEMMEHILEM